MLATINLVHISTSAIFIENGGNWDHLMLWNLMEMTSRKTLNVVYFVFLKYMKSHFMCS